MKVIGIITKNDNIIKTKEDLEKMNIKDKNIIIICEENIINVKNVRFDILIIAEEINKSHELNEIINNCKYLIINTDIKENIEITKYIKKCYVITYGFNSKSTITIISNEENETIIEIQRQINGLYGNKIDMQELKINRNLEKCSIYYEIAFKILRFLIKI